MKDTSTRLQWILLIAICLFMAACAAGPNSAAGTPAADGNVYGFWYGLWHGMIAGITFVVGLFEPGVRAYEVHNNGNWYDLGFVLGIGSFSGGCTCGVRYGTSRSHR
jgi:hypothetical protein